MDPSPLLAKRAPEISSKKHEEGDNHNNEDHDDIQQPALMWDPPRLRKKTGIHHVCWFELFFDLAFVIGIGGCSHLW